MQYKVPVQYKIPLQYRVPIECITTNVQTVNLDLGVHTEIKHAF